jgi:lipoate-protein ligase A
MDRYLRTPPRQPEYRQQRSHLKFVDNLPVDPRRVKLMLRDAWSAQQPLVSWPVQRVAELVANRYSQEHWNLRL